VIESQPPPLPANHEPVKRWRLWAHLLLILPYPLLLLAASASREGSHRSALTGGWKGLLVVCGTELGIFGAFLALALWASRSTRDELLLRFHGLGKFLPLGIGYSVAIRLGIGLIAGIVATVLLVTKVITMEGLQEFAKLNRPDIESVVDVKALKNDPLYYWLSLTVVSFIVAGLREELWRTASLTGMRKLWPQHFESRRGQLMAVVLTSLVFGIGHFPQGVLAMVMTGLIGVALGTIMVLHRSVWPAVIAHGMFDATSFALVPLVLG
jgi:membrane protease YdiL (CAAX protease family)